jgi:Flp pilus assembly CpaF family ATPase
MFRCCGITCPTPTAEISCCARVGIMARSGVCCISWTRRSITLQVPLPDIVSMQTRQANLEGTGEITLRRLVKEALRMRPNRIIVGEVRQEECLDLLIALNSGRAHDA